MLLKSEQAPLPPAFAFTGEVKRRGWYNAVSPGFVERASVRQELGAGMAQAAQRRRWYAALPVRFGDEPSKLPRLPDPTTDPEYRDELPDGVTSVSVGYVRRPAQLLALRRLKQAPANNAVLSAALELAAAVEADGPRDDRSWCRCRAISSTASMIAPSSPCPSGSRCPTPSKRSTLASSSKKRNSERSAWHENGMCACAWSPRRDLTRLRSIREYGRAARSRKFGRAHGRLFFLEITQTTTCIHRRCWASCVNRMLLLNLSLIVAEQSPVSLLALLRDLEQHVAVGARPIPCLFAVGVRLRELRFE